jgi:hypothetical protein
MEKGANYDVCYAVAMSVENPHFQNQLESLIRVSHEFAYRTGGDPEILDDYAIKLLNSVLEAYERGVPRNEIETAVKLGFRQGELQLTDPSLTTDYWQAVRNENESRTKE